MWSEHGAALVARGWRAIPVLPPVLPPDCLANGAGKAPGTWIGNDWVNSKDWQLNGVPSATSLKRYQSWPPCGIGIVLGKQGDGSIVVAVDIDVRDPAVADEIEALARKMLGPAPLRVGQWPKRLLLYRCTEEIRKRQTANYSMPGDPPKAQGHHVEILATGEQFVAFGRHKCGRDYTWTEGSPATLAPSELTLVTPGVLQHFRDLCDFILLDAGCTVITKCPPNQDRAKNAGGEPNQALHAGLLALLYATGRILKVRRDRVDILCPFMDDHPERGDTGTALLPGGGIHCFHATCNGRPMGDYIAKLKELAAENGLDGAAIYGAAAHPKQLEIARGEFDEIDEAALTSLRSAPRPTAIRSEHQRLVRHAARARCKAQTARAAWERLVKAAQKGEAP